MGDEAGRVRHSQSAHRKDTSGPVEAQGSPKEEARLELPLSASSGPRLAHKGARCAKLKAVSRNRADTKAEPPDVPHMHASASDAW